MKKNKKPESVLLIILAETRAYEHTFNLFKKNLIEVFDADLCLCVAENEREDKNNPFYQHAKYIWTYDEPEDWGDAFDFAQKIEGYDKNWRKLLEVKDQWLGGIKGEGEHPGSAGILLFFRWFLKDSILKHHLLEKYDRFVVTRSDFIHMIPHVPLQYLHPSKVWIPYGEDYGGYTDRHIIAHRKDILNVLSISDQMLSDPELLFEDMNFYANWNLEKYIKFSFSRLGLEVRRYPYTMYSVRSVDGHTRWREGNYHEELGYCIKYPQEYMSSQTAANIIKEKEDWSKSKIYLLNTITFLFGINVIKKIIYRLKLNWYAKKIFCHK